ncbi:30S ribosome-binding factor RbfA [Emcibacteraceae bacterium]|jgi:ribosome-binding factor A|nr:30S ribosome-binding factor RbfA [Emcibacteraceae bacterium]MDC0082322.1 30S ribosome-binding factor RbfA [Emcibacteraceae bacterium]MDC1429771.1 30S ribosome-binding factor RbfA [Emcibacteraceae bacterium]|tara:strand:+ start:1281 stop:1682 length:402 start_codon:yes stop_codon:yes gene_type:complete
MSKSKFENDGGPSQRVLRVGENIRHALSDIFLRGEIRDPTLEGVSVTVTEVRCSPDLRNATIFVMPLAGKNEKKVVEGLNENVKFIRGQLSKMVRMKYLPNLKFISDHSFGTVDHMEDLLNSAHVIQDLKKDD